MTFWAGLLLERQVFLVIDRFTLTAGFEYGWRRLLNSPHLHIRSERKYLMVNPTTFLLPGGCQRTSHAICEILKNHFGSDPIDPRSLTDFGKEFRARAGEAWKNDKAGSERACELAGVGLPGVDCLLAGIGPAGRPWFCAFDDANDFHFKIAETAPQYMTFPMGPLQKSIESKIRDFISIAWGKPDPEQRELGLKHFVGLTFLVSTEKRFVSSWGDAIFLSQDGARIYKSRIWPPWRYKVVSTLIRDVGGGLEDLPDEDDLPDELCDPQKSSPGLAGEIGTQEDPLAKILVSNGRFA